MYSFLSRIILFFFLLLPVGIWSALLTLFCLGLFFHTVATFSAFGRIIMHTGAMSSTKILDEEYEKSLSSLSLQSQLLVEALSNLNTNTNSFVRRQQHQVLHDEKLIHSNVDDFFDDNHDKSRDASSWHFIRKKLPWNQSDRLKKGDGPKRKRTDSSVKFADGYDTNAQPINLLHCWESSLVTETPPEQEIHIVHHNHTKSAMSAITLDSSLLPSVNMAENEKIQFPPQSITTKSTSSPKTGSISVGSHVDNDSPVFSSRLARRWVNSMTNGEISKNDQNSGDDDLGDDDDDNDNKSGDEIPPLRLEHNTLDEIAVSVVTENHNTASNIQLQNCQPTEILAMELNVEKSLEVEKTGTEMSRNEQQSLLKYEHDRNKYDSMEPGPLWEDPWDAAGMT
jgi:hypothetical protein